MRTGTWSYATVVVVTVLCTVAHAGDFCFNSTSPPNPAPRPVSGTACLKAAGTLLRAVGVPLSGAGLGA